MDTEKIGELIKKIRHDNNLTQKDLADKYGVTYQAVSKWENGKNLPDISLITQIANDYNIELSDILNVKNKDRKEFKASKKYFVILLFLIIVALIVFIALKNNSSFQFKTIEANCKDFTVTGSLAFDSKKSSIYISNINYCGTEENVYKELTCNLYEKNSNTITEISSCDKASNVTLNEYLKNVKFNVDNFSKTCSNYTQDSLYLEINAYDDNNNLKVYKIPLSLDDNCN